MPLTTKIPPDLQVQHNINLEELRDQLSRRLSLLMMTATGLWIWFTIPQHIFPLPSQFGSLPPAFAYDFYGLLAALFLLGLLVYKLTPKHPLVARHLLVWGATAVLVIGMWLHPHLWLPFWGILLIFCSTALLSGSQIVTTGILLLTTFLLTRNGLRVYPLPDIIVTLLLSLGVAWASFQTFYLALNWALTAQQQADQLLQLTRSNRAQLTQTVKSLELANFLQQRTQRELDAARQQAESARLMKEQFAANISHELRTPLNLILGFSEVMHKSPEIYTDVTWTPTLSRDIRHIYRSSQHLLAMIDDILDLSRFEMTGFALNKEPTPLNDLVDDTLPIAEDLFRGHTAVFIADIEPDLPTLVIDRTRIRQVLLNLLNNARRYTNTGTVRLEVTQSEQEICFAVHDTGTGIPSEKLARIFDAFYRIDSTLRREDGGAGLGLAISKRFVEAHNGRIGATSVVNQGSTFYFVLPNKQTPPYRFQDQSIWPEMQQATNRTPVLVVDVDTAVADQLQRQLDTYHVIPIVDETRITEAILTHHPQAAICNVAPGKECAAIADITLSVPLIECSLPSRTWIAQQLSIMACLTKPVTRNHLLAAVQELDDLSNILVIDDDRGFSQLIAQIFRSSGRSVTIKRAYNGEEGLAILQQWQPDLILLDLIMPGMDGFAVIKHIQADKSLSTTPIILLTATTFGEDILASHPGRLTIYHPGGLMPREVIACVQAIIEVLQPHYHDETQFTPQLKRHQPSARQ